MFYVIPNRLAVPVDTKKTDIIKLAYSRILAYRLTPAVLELSQYLQTKYNKDLKTICKELVVRKVNISAGAENDTFIVTYTDEESENLAKLITYGNSEIKGCNILQFAFKQNY